MDDQVHCSTRSVMQNLSLMLDQAHTSSMAGLGRCDRKAAACQEWVVCMVHRSHSTACGKGGRRAAAHGCKASGTPEPDVEGHQDGTACSNSHSQVRLKGSHLTGTVYYIASNLMIKMYALQCNEAAAGAADLRCHCSCAHSIAQLY